MKERELVSIIIPTYKNRGGLSKSIDSVLQQDYENIEILVVDDNEPDSEWRNKTERLMSDYLANSKVKYIKHPENKNGAAARNTGIRYSKGQYIAFLDDDDWFLPEKLTKQISFLQNNLDVDSVYCLAQRKGKRYGHSEYEGDVSKELLLLKTNMFTPCLMFRRKAILSIEGFDETFRRHQDYDLLLRFFNAGYKIGCLKEQLTEIGVNMGENEPYGLKLRELKEYFFEKFSPYIESIDKQDRGFKNKVYAIHYAGAFLTQIKHHYFREAISYFIKYGLKDPIDFFSVINTHFWIHFKNRWNLCQN